MQSNVPHLSALSSPTDGIQIRDQNPSMKVTIGGQDYIVTVRGLGSLNGETESVKRCVEDIFQNQDLRELLEDCHISLRLSHRLERMEGGLRLANGLTQIEQDGIPIFNKRLQHHAKGLLERVVGTWGGDNPLDREIDVTFSPTGSGHTWWELDDDMEVETFPSLPSSLVSGYPSGNDARTQELPSLDFLSQSTAQPTSSLKRRRRHRSRRKAHRPPSSGAKSKAQRTDDNDLIYLGGRQRKKPLGRTALEELEHQTSLMGRLQSTGRKLKSWVSPSKKTQQSDYSSPFPPLDVSWVND